MGMEEEIKEKKSLRDGKENFYAKHIIRDDFHRAKKVSLLQNKIRWLAAFHTLPTTTTKSLH